MFVGMAHNGLPSLHTILEESANEGHTTSREGGSSDFPIFGGCNMVTPIVPITTTPPHEGTLTRLTIVMVLL
jgi:hypothetical protein